VSGHAKKKNPKRFRTGNVVEASVSNGDAGQDSDVSAKKFSFPLDKSFCSDR